MSRCVKTETWIGVGSLALCIAVFFMEAQAAPCPVKCGSTCKSIGGYYYSNCFAYCDDNDCTNFVKNCNLCDVGSCCQPNDKQVCCNLNKDIRRVRFTNCEKVCPAILGISTEADSFEDILTTNAPTSQYDCKDPVSGKCP